MAKVKKLIDQAEIISFSLIDTMVYRKVNSPETIFDLVDQHYDIHGFKNLRVRAQNEANRRSSEKEGQFCADINKIYAVLAENKDISADWKEVMAYEIQMEKDAMTVNPVIKVVYDYAKEKKKRIVVTIDTYLPTTVIREILTAAGYNDVDQIICTADDHKCYKELFISLQKNSKTSYDRVLHIGSDKKRELEPPAALGIRAFLYQAGPDMAKFKKFKCSDVDNGIYRILYNNEKSFWYNLGAEAGGPIYLGWYQWVEKIIKESNRKVVVLFPQGAILYHLLKRKGYKEIECLDPDRKTLLLAGIRELDEEAIQMLPPYTTGQTVGEILDELGVQREQIEGLEENVFSDYNHEIETEEDIDCFKKLYTNNKNVFLKRFAEERDRITTYLEQKGFFADETILFDCGWDGTSQYLMDRLYDALDHKPNYSFYYYGVLNTEKSRSQLHGKHYQTYAFDFYTNHGMQMAIERALPVYDLFFSMENLSGKTGVKTNQEELLKGITDYLEIALPFVRKYEVEITPEASIGHLERLISKPTDEEARTIGDLCITEDCLFREAKEQRIAYLADENSNEDADEEPKYDIKWIQGFLRREDISEKLKKEVAKQKGLQYSEPEEPKYHLEDEQSIRNYHRYLDHLTHNPPEKKALDYQPMFSIVMPVYNTETTQLRAAIDSVLNQTYSNYELILVDDHSTWDNVAPLLHSYEGRKHVQVCYRKTNGHISEATNDGLKQAKGDFIAFMDCDDTIEPDALYWFAAKLNENPELDFIYSDEDRITEDGKIRHLPFFKPDWSPDLFLSLMYTNHLAVYRASLVQQTGGLRTAYNGSQDYDFTLRFMELTDNRRVGHIPMVLYHWRERKEFAGYAMSAKNYAVVANRNAKKEALKRRKIKGHLEYCPDIYQYRVVYEPQGNPLVSIIIPSKDHPEILEQCVRSIREFTDYPYYEIIVVDNGSNKENKETISKFLSDDGDTYVYGQYTFNFSLMCNRGAAKASGDFLLFLNDDVEIIQRDWLERLLGQAQQEHTGAVGAKLLYPETTLIQHAGVADIYEGPSHNFLRLDDKYTYYFGMNRNNYNCVAVTGACLMVRNDIFRKIHGFDENFPVAYNDVDLCMKIHELGLYNVQRNDVFAYHHESLSRGNDLLSHEKMLRLCRERLRLYNAHPKLQRNDPFLNKNLHMMHETLDPLVKFDIKEELQEVPTDVNGICNIDSVVRTDRVRIVGWTVLPERQDNEELVRYLVTQDPFGNTYQTRMRNLSRMDVAVALNRDDFMQCGFECVLDPAVFRNDLMTYRLGVITCIGNDQKYIAWSPKPVNPCWTSERELLYNEIIRKEQYEPKTSEAQNPYWNLDAIETQEEGFVISGWAFTLDKHYLYEKQIILRDENNNAYIFETTMRHRMDVSTVFPQKHFLFSTGFQCSIYTESIPMGHSYEIILRLVNKVNPEDTCDYPTTKNIQHYLDRRQGKKLKAAASTNEELALLRKFSEQNTKTIEELLTKLSERQTQYDTLEQQNRNLENEKKSLEYEKASLQESYRQLSEKFDYVNSEYNRVSNAAFWKMTKPARFVLDKIKAAIRH